MSDQIYILVYMKTQLLVFRHLFVEKGISHVYLKNSKFSLTKHFLSFRFMAARGS